MKWGKVAMVVGPVVIAFAVGRGCAAGGDAVERVAVVEHDQWMEWSKSVAPEVSPERRAKWEKYWVPYEKLPDDIKELDRIWARKAVAAIRDR